MIDTTYRRRLLGTSMFAGAALVAAASLMAAPAMAQTQDEGQDSLDDIVVTGSRIARQDYVSTSPIVTVGREDFQATGSVTIDTLLNDLPQFVPSVGQTSNNPGGGGQANINLRGLGTVRTLVLMNGRRVIPSSSDGVVDINIFPTALIRNVEVISGGASAAYGSDALAGVANFILDDQFEGVQLDAQYGVTDREDGTTESYSVTVGSSFADDRGHAVFSIGRSTRDLIFNAARDFSAISGASGTSPLGSTVFDANNQPTNAFVRSYFNDATLTNSGSFGFNDNGSVFSYVRQLGFVSPGGADYDGFRDRSTDYLYNTGGLNYNQLPLERWNAYTSLNYKLNDAAEVYGNFLFTEYSSDSELAASPAAAATGFRVPSTNPFITPALRSFLNARPNPTAGFRLDKRFNEVGGRHSTDNYTIYQGTFGVRGDLVGLKDWTYDIYGQYGRNERTTLQTGNVSRSSVQTLLDAADGGRSICAGGFDPFGVSNLSPACVAYIARTSQNVTAQEQTVIEASLQGGLIDLPAGEARFAAGIQYREDDYDFRPDASLSRVNPTVCTSGVPITPTTPCLVGTTGGSEIAGFNPVPALRGNTNSVEYFAEFLVPLLADLPFIQSLDLNLGYRYSDYSTVGGVKSYKADLDWAIVDSFRLRGGYSRSVRAPSIGELFAAGGTNFPAIGAPSATGLSGDPCDIRSSYRQASNPNAAAVRALCIAQGISASSIDSFVFSNNQVSGISGGNPNLFEETSDSFTAGAVFTSPFANPWLSGFSASIDYYNIEITDVIGSVGASTQLQGCFNAQGQNPTYSASNGFCQLFVRDPLSGSVQGAQEIQANLATLKTSGVDAQFDWTIGLADVGAPDWGSLSFNVVVGWLENRERQDVAGGPFIDRTGTIDSVFGNTFPEWKGLTSVTWAYGPVAVGARWRHVGEMTQFATTTELDSADYYDLNASWAINDTVSLRATVNNVGDEQPIVFSPGVQANTDPSTYDTLGRRYSVGLTARF